MQEQPSHWRKVWPEGCVDNGDSDAETESFVPAGAYYDGQAVQLSAGGIPYHALMNEQPSHWRKVWPEGAVDNSDGDAEIIDRFNKQPPANQMVHKRNTHGHMMRMFSPPKPVSSLERRLLVKNSVNKSTEVLI